MLFAGILFGLFTVLAVLGLFLLLHHHYGKRAALVWSTALLLAFLALGWWVYRIAEGSGLG